MADPEEVYAALDAIGIEYQRYEHPPVFTGEAAAEHWGRIPGTQVKNLFLRNKKGDRHYLVILGIGKQADLRQLVKVIGDDRFSFGSPERLMATLGSRPAQCRRSDCCTRGPRRAGDRRSGSANDGPADFPPQPQYPERDDLGGGLRTVPCHPSQHGPVAGALNLEVISKPCC